MFGFSPFRIFSIVALFALAFAPFAQAFSLSTSSPNVGITSCTEGKAFVYAANPFTNDGTLSFTGSFGELSGYFESPSQLVPGGATRGTFVHFSSPQCFQGTQDATVFAQLCVNGECGVEQITIRVTVSPCSDCPGGIQTSTAPVDYYIPSAPSSTDGTMPLASGIYFSTQFDPSYYEINIYGKDEVDLRQGDDATVELSIVNEGAAGTFDLNLIGDTGRLEARVNSDYVSLARGEARTVTIDVQPATVTGKYCIALQATRQGGVVVQEKFVCFNVYDKLGATIKLPATISATRCDSVQFQAVLQNVGSAQDTYHLQAYPFAQVSFPYITLVPSETGYATVKVDANALALGRNQITIYAEGEARDALNGETSKGQGTVDILVSDCVPKATQIAAPSQTTQVSTTQNPNGTNVKFVAQVFNDGNETLEAVTANIIGLPEGWEVTPQEPNGISVAPNETKNLTLFIKPASQDTAEGLLEVRSGAEKLFSKTVKVDGKTGDVSLVGFFVLALSDNLLFISVLILAALAVVVMGARKKYQTQVEAAKLDKVKKSISEY